MLQKMKNYIVFQRHQVAARAAIQQTVAFVQDSEK